MFIVMCRVSGGVTGTRQSEAKRDGAVMHFETRDEAQKHASHMTELYQNNPYRVADFKYWVEER